MILVISVILTTPIHSFAETQEEIEPQGEIIETQGEVETHKEIILVSEDEEILLYETPSEDTMITEIPNNTKVILLESNDDNYSYVQYKSMDVDQEEGEILKGFVKNIYIATEEQVNHESQAEEKSEQEETEVGRETEQEETENVDSVQEPTEKMDEPEEGFLENDQEMDKQEKEGAGEESLVEMKEDKPKREDTKSTVVGREDIDISGKQKTVEPMNVKTYRGITLKTKTYIRTEPATTSKPLKTFPIGTVLEIQPFNANWYTLAKKIDGQIGYIHKKHLEKVTGNQEKLRGVALKSPTNVRMGPSTKAQIIQTYPIGSILEYKTFSTHWYELSIGGKTGYIHKKHVENAVEQQKSEIGITLKSPTNIRARASTNAPIIATFQVGSILEYKTFSTCWYEVSVEVNGKKMTGYIHRNHIEKAENKMLRGVARKQTTYIRSKPSTKSDPLTTYRIGTVLSYQVHNAHWYKVSIAGKGMGYVHKKHVENTVMNQKTLRGVTLKPKTYIRESASTKSSALATRPIGTIFNYKTFSDHWYEVDLGNRRGYIHKKHVENATATGKASKGVALKKKTFIRMTPSTKAGSLTTYAQGSIIHYTPFNKNWHEVQMNIKGKKVTGFIHKKHIGNQKVVFIDPGHGGYDSGASGNGLREKDITLDISKRVAAQLRATGYIAIMSRDNDRYVSLANRTKHANSMGADIFVSVHVNAGGGTGIETWMMNKGPEPGKSKVLADNLQKEMINQTKTTSRGVKDGNLHVNRESKMPSALVEVGFIDRKTDADKLKQASYKEKLARGIVNGIKKYFQIFK